MKKFLPNFGLLSAFVLLPLCGCGDDAPPAASKLTAQKADTTPVLTQSVILDMPALLGKPYRKSKKSFAHFRETQTYRTPAYVTGHWYKGGMVHVFQIGPSKNAGGSPQEMMVDVSSHGDITRMTATDVSGLGNLDQFGEAFAKFGIRGLPSPDRDAPKGKSWERWHNMALSVVVGPDSDGIWMIQASFPE